MRERNIEFSKKLIERFNKQKMKIKPIIDDNFHKDTWKELIELADNGKGGQLFSALNNIWFILPDTKYNIIENPPGWNEFLYVIEV